MTAMNLALLAFLATKTLDVVFVPDAGPIVVVSIDDTAKRTITWAVVGGTAGAISDDPQRAPPSPWPQAPKGAQVIDRGGSLSIVIDDAGAWQDAFATPAPALPKSKPPPSPAKLPVPGPTSMRLAIDPSSGDPAAATLSGATVSIAGRAVVRTDAQATRAVVVAGKDVLEAPAVAVDVVSACDRTVPSSASAIGAAALKLFASGPAVCAGALAIVPVSGAKLDAKKDVPAAGVVVARAAGP
jgi:hypothetical protein